jgi:hypothetical protein
MPLQQKESIMKMHGQATALAAAMLFLAASAIAAPYSVTHSDTLETNSTLPAGITSGQPMTTTFVFDNGGSVAASQTWSAANVQCVIFRFNSAADKFVAVNYSAAPFTTATTGSFTTDAGGVLQAGTIRWIDAPASGIPTAQYATNVVTAVPLAGWYINAINDVVLWDPASANPSVGYLNVGNDTTTTNWSNPQPASGVCASFFAPAAAQGVPALSEWGLIMLTVLIAAAAFGGLGRQRV